VGTNFFGPGGSFIFSNAPGTNATRMFILLRLP
jgi:hypothetical protein